MNNSLSHMAHNTGRNLLTRLGELTGAHELINAARAHHLKRAGFSEQNIRHIQRHAQTLNVVVFRFGCGHIDHACSEALQLRLLKRKPVVFKFNQVTLVATDIDTPDTLRSKYSTATS